jgi:hypothetical protein
MLEVDSDRAKRLVNRVLAKDPRGRELTAAEVRELLLSYGIDLVRSTRSAASTKRSQSLNGLAGTWF